MRIGPDDDSPARDRHAQPFVPVRLSAQQAFFDRTPAALMHSCPSCQQPRLMMTDCQRQPADQRRFVMSVRCPDCGWFYRGTFSKEQMFALADAMEAAYEQMMADLKKLKVSRHEQTVLALRQALEDGSLSPSDF